MTPPGPPAGTTSGASSDEIRLARAVLSRLAEPAGRPLWELVERYGPVEALARAQSGELGTGHGAPTAARLARATDDQARRDLDLIAQLGGRLVIPEDDEWPVAALADLRWIHTDEDPAMPPLALWVRGRHPLAAACERAVAVVGARAATSYGGHVAGETAFGLAERGWTVVSGGAYGIDAAAHRGALGADGLTVAVLACGVDRAYPAGNSTLFDRIADAGLLLSEWPPGTVPHRVRFLIRNRVIAALAAGTVVVEAAARSGARQTARRAAELSRALLAVPGPVTSTLSVGCHQLIRQHGATLVTSAAEIVEEVGTLGASFADPPRGPEQPRDLLDPVARAVLDAMPTRAPASVDELTREAAVDALSVLRSLPELIEAGLVEEHGAGYRLTPAARRAARHDPPTLR